MHQHPRPTQKRSSPSTSAPSTARFANQREENTARDVHRQNVRPELERPPSGTSSEGVGRSEESSNTGTPKPETDKINLIVQHFFTKAALVILRSRSDLPTTLTKEGDVRLEKWFNLWTEDSNSLTPYLEEWKNMEAHVKRPEPLVIDIYLDCAKLTQNQTLVAIDDNDNRWSVNEALEKASPESNTSTTSLVYERWTISLEDPVLSSLPPTQLADPPPNVYKKGVVLFRSLFTYSRLLPAWKFARRMSRNIGNGPLPKCGFKISKGVDPRKDTLTLPVFAGDSAVTGDYHFAPLPCALGSIKVSVKYRTSCNFEVDAAERLLSERFAPTTATSSGRASDSTSGELSQDSRYKPWVRMPTNSEEEVDSGITRAGTTIRAASGSKSSLRSEAGPTTFARRPSVSFQPFKAGSLSSSPAGGLQISSSGGSSLGKSAGMTLPSHNRSRSSLNALPQQALRTPGIPQSDAIPITSGSGSPKPAPVQRFSSSFSNRKARFPSSVGSKTEDDGNSSRGSVSSTHRGSISLQEPENASNDDSDNISDFIKMLEKSSKGLPSLSKTDQASLNANSQRTAAQYSKFSKMRDSTAQLSESMSSSLMLHRSSTSSSRQLSNVPGLISASSSPSKPVSPHTPHMPTVPSRLSNNSIADYSRDEARHRHRAQRARASGVDEDRSAETEDRDQGTTAIDIPASPRTYPTSRRSSSVHQQGRNSSHIDDDVLPFGLRSASLPNDERPAYAGDDDEPLLFAMGELGSQRRFD